MASFLPLELRDYADQVVEVAGKAFTVKELVYVNQEDFYSTGGLVPDSNGLIAANSQFRLWQTPIGSAGQGFTAPMTVSETNNTQGSRFGGNELLLVYSVGFEFAVLTSVSSLIPTTDRLFDQDIRNLGMGLSWSLQIGSGISRVQGVLGQYPYGAGAYIGAATAIDTDLTTLTTAVYAAQNGGPNVPARKRSSLLAFPPNIEININVQNGSAIQLDDTAATWGSKVLAVRGNMRAFRFTVPVG